MFYIAIFTYTVIGGNSQIAVPFCYYELLVARPSCSHGVSRSGADLVHDSILIWRAMLEELDLLGTFSNHRRR